MVQILLTPEQSAQLAAADGPVLLVNPQGQTVGQVAPPDRPSHFSPERLAAAKARVGKDGPYVTTPELLQRLRELDVRQ